MKCLNCGAESPGKFCEYCGSEMPQEKITCKCPKCGESKVVYERETVSTTNKYHTHENHFGNDRQSESVSQSIYRTVGICQNCGYTWDPDAAEPSPKRKVWLWVLGWIFIFPVPLTILMLRNQEMKPALKYGIIALAWIVFLAIGIFGNVETDTPQTGDSSYPSENSGFVTDDNADSFVKYTHAYEDLII